MEVEHEAERQRFVRKVEGGVAELSYAKPREGVLDLQHTLVPPAAREQGVGASLVEYAFGFARENDLQVIPTCSFVKRWLSEHSDERDLVAESV